MDELRGKISTLLDQLDGQISEILQKKKEGIISTLNISEDLNKSQYQKVLLLKNIAQISKRDDGKILMKIKGLHDKDSQEDLQRFKDQVKFSLDCASHLIQNSAFKNFIKIFKEDFLYPNNLQVEEYFNGIKITNTE